MDNNCKGCSIQDKCVFSHTFNHKDTEYNCPCVECLIKSMCNKTCKPFTKYSTVSFKYMHGNDFITFDKTHPKTFEYKLSDLRSVPLLVKRQSIHTHRGREIAFPVIILNNKDNTSKITVGEINHN